MSTGYIPFCLRNIPKKKKIPTKKQVRNAKLQLIKDIRERMILKKRTIPKEWERGFMSAVSVIEQYEIK